MTIEKVSVKEWCEARNKKPMTQPEVAEMLFSSLDSVKSWDVGRNPIGRGLFNYFLIMTGQHPTIPNNQKHESEA